MERNELNEIIKQLKEGNNIFLQKIFEEHGLYCIKQLKIKYNCPVEDAEDIFIEAVLNFREKVIKGQITFLSNIRNYVFTTCNNMWLSRHRQDLRKIKKTSEVQRFFYEELNHSHEDIKEEITYKESLLNISRKAFNELDEKCRDLLHYFYIDNLKMKEIAGKMGFASAEVAKTSKSRCYKKLIGNAKNIQKSYDPESIEIKKNYNSDE